jgi:hypothetical protein
MAIDEKGLESFKRIYTDTFNENLSQEEIERKARSLLALYLAVYQAPMQTIREIETLTTNESGNEEH